MNDDGINTVAPEAPLKDVPPKEAMSAGDAKSEEGGVPTEQSYEEIKTELSPQVDEITPRFETNLTIDNPPTPHHDASKEDKTTHDQVHADSQTTNTSTDTPTSTTTTSQPSEPSNTEPATFGDSSTTNDVATSSATSTSSTIPPKDSPSNKMRGSTITFANGGNPTNIPSFSLNSSAVIEEDSGSDTEEASRRKGKRKAERGYSKIILEHKKNQIGEIIFKGHPSWVLMLNIQTGIRNAVGKSMHQSRSFQNPRTLTSSYSQPQPSPPTQPTTLPPSNSQPLTASPPALSPPVLNFGPNGVLAPDQFEKIEEFYASPRVLQFPSAGSSQTIPHQTGPFKFKDYCPHAFRFLRHRFGIDQADYMVSLCNTQKNGENALRELPTPGKSGSLFFFSHDMRFILKTIPKSEAKLLRLLLPSYVEHIANDENTLLPKFYGLHRVKPHKGRQVRFVVMSNVFQTRKKIHERYDLKGSTLGRAASEEEKKKDTVTFKDLDFRERHMKLQIGPQRKGALVEQLRRDSKFLGQLNIMDYSLLIGIHYEDREDRSGPPSPLPPAIAAKLQGPPNPEYFHSIFQTNDGGMRGVDEGGNPTGTYYYMGIIDILMLYSVRKKVEHTYKTLRYRKDGNEISAISPPDYADRFYEFISTSIV